MVDYEKLADYYSQHRQEILMKNRMYRLKNKVKIDRMRRKYNRKVKSGIQKVHRRHKVGRTYVNAGYH